MLDRLRSPAVASAAVGLSLGRRRALFAALVVATIAGLLCLAATAVPPLSVGAVLFLVLFAATLPWSVVGFWNAVIGFSIMRGCRDPVAAVNPMAARIRGDEPITAATAILLCVRNESPRQVMRNLLPLLDGLAASHFSARFHVYVLSDSGDPEIVAAEEACVGALATSWRRIVPITYRRRPVNVGFKAGNIRDFCVRWGQDHDFAVTLDADSFMPAATVLRLVRIMQANPTLGILQTLVIGLPSMSAFARLFQFGMRLGMHSYTLGAAWWQGDCGPYWGHNAILRLRPFIEHCDLPILPQRRPLGGHILSHDQVEAALMRRAGYEVRVVPEGMSWEENPPTLLEYIRRDLRWCQGNMQYWRLLNLPGLKPVSRFQLLCAILMYLNSPAWIALVTLGAVTLALGGAPVAAQVTSFAGATLFPIILFMIFAPKIASATDVLMRPSVRRSFGGGGRFVLNVMSEMLFSFLLSPIPAVSHTLFLFRLFVLRRGGAWNSQLRESHAVPWRLAAARFWPHTLAGLAIIGVVATRTSGGVAYAFVAGGGLAISIPFAVATASPRVGAFFSRFGVGRIPEEIEPPAALFPLRLPAIQASLSNAAVACRDPALGMD